MAARVREDRIVLSGVKLQPRIGVTPGERRLPQSCDAEVTVYGDFEAAATTDSLGKAIDYSRILALIIRVAHEREYNLLESLAYRIAREILQSTPASRVGVRVRKRPASLQGKLDYIEVEVQES